MSRLKEIRRRIRVRHVVFVLLILWLGFLSSYLLYKYAILDTGISLKYEEWNTDQLTKQKESYTYMAEVMKCCLLSTSIGIVIILFWGFFSNLRKG